MKFLFKLSGSIACYKACDLISRLVKAGHEVQTVTTPAAERFIGPATLEGLTGRANLSDLWKTGDQMAHIRLPEWADATILCPASASTVNRMAAGVADDLVTTLFLAHDFSKPYYMAPAMNPRMLNHPATAEAFRKLTNWGVRLLPTEEGVLACKDIGPGRLLDPELLFNAITTGQSPPEREKLRILITSGGTEEPIDSVRVITNRSSGRTGSFLADHFAKKGAKVSLLRARRAEAPRLSAVRQQTYGTTAELEALLRTELGAAPFDLVIHAAAVSDYTVEAPESGPTPSKLPSGQAVQLTLLPAPKLLPQIKGWSAPHPAPLLIGFKLTDHLDAPAPEDPDHPAKTLLERSGADAVVHNARASIAADGAPHPCRLFFPDDPLRFCSTKSELAEAIWEFVLQRRPVAG